MKFKRKPVVRDVVDALHDGANYLVQRESGIDRVPTTDFDRDYEPVKRSPSTKPKKARKKKGAVTAA